MAKRKNKKNQQALKGLVVVIIIAIITILGDKIKLDNINNLVEEVSTNNVVANQVSEDSNEVIDGENVDVYYLDVGQADSILVQSNGMNMLIDAGTNDMGKTVVRDLQALGIKKIDVLIGTHPHEDHIGGLDDVIKNFDIGTIYMPKVQTNTKTFEDVLDAINEKGLKITSPEVGYKFNIGNAICEVMNCGTGTSEEKSNLNLSSIVIRMTYGEQSFLFMGDAEKVAESTRTWPKVDVLKVGHHGSNTSSSDNFLKQVKPHYAVIEVGKDNKYNLPNSKAITRIENSGATILRTDLKQESIWMISDGNNIEVKEIKLNLDGN